MYQIKLSNKFKKDLKKIKKSGHKKKDLDEIAKIINILAIPETLPEKNKDHSLSGNFREYRECHIFPDLLLIYRYSEEHNAMLLYRIGSHSELF